MPTYYDTGNASDLSPSWSNTTAFDNEIQNSSTSVDVSHSLSLTASQIKSGSIISQSGNPNSDDWEDGGTWTVKVTASSNMNIRSRCRVTRLQSDATIDQQGSFTGYQTFTGGGTFTFSPAAPTWSTTEACTHRIAIEMEFENLDTMMTQTSTLTLNSTIVAVDILVTDITEDAGTCGGTTFTPKCVMF